MKNKIFLSIAFFAISLFIIPQMTFASWWKPNTWKIFNRKFEVKIEQKIIATSTSNNVISQTEKATTTPMLSRRSDQSVGAEKIEQKSEEVKKNDQSKEIEKLKKEVEALKQKQSQFKIIEKITEKPIIAEKKESSSSQTKQNEKIDDVNLPSNPAIVAIDNFLLNPTVDNLISFCNTAKTLPGITQKKILNDTRTDFVMKTLTLYEEGSINEPCNLAFGIHKLKSGEYLSASEFHAYFQWINYNPSYILEFNPNDSNSVREIKINFNNYWKSLSAYKLIGFPTYSTSSDTTKPNAVVEKIISRFIGDDGEISAGGIRYLKRTEGIHWDHIIPEKILSELRRRFINR